MNLVYLDRDADIAVFVPTPDSAGKRGNPEYSVDLAAVGSIDDENDPIRAEDKNLFAAYYPGPPQTVTQANLGQEREREAEKAGITDVFQFLGWEGAKALGSTLPKGPPVRYFNPTAPGKTQFMFSAFPFRTIRRPFRA